MAVKLLNAVTTTGASARWRANCKDHTIQINVTGNPTAVTVDLEGSLDDNTYFRLASHNFDTTEITNQASMFHVETKMVDYIKANLTTLTGGTSPTVTVRYFSETS